jgi:hypothetical protein
MISEPTSSQSVQPETLVLRISPLVWLGIMGLYVALMLPLPFLAQVTQAPVPASGLAVAIAIGGLLIYATLTERVKLDEQGIEVFYPRWVPKFYRRGWSLPWTEIEALKPRSTGQGGLVYYLVSRSGAAFLLPIRVVGFARMVRYIQTKTGIDTSAIKPLAQPWMYGTLSVFALFTLLMDAWVLGTAIAGF